jgi:enoyl-CoA hydratase
MEQNFNTLQVELIDHGILHITLSRPDKLNALSQELLTELEQLLRTVKNDVKVKALLLTGSGKVFCAGADISQLAKLDPQDGERFATYGQSVFRLLETLGKPSIAAIHGVAAGGGCELAMAATLRIAALDTKFSQPEVKLGLIPGFGGTQRLPRLIGKGRALDLCLTGRFINAQQALDWGLVSAVTSQEELIPQALRWLKDIAARSPIAVRHVIDVIDCGFDLPLEEALHLEALHFAQCCATQDKQEGIAAFLAKREPEFKGI